MPPRRRNSNKEGNGDGKGEPKRPRKSIRESKEVPTPNLESSEQVFKDDYLARVVLRFKKAEYISLTPKNLNGNFLVVNFLLKGFDLDFFKFPEKAILFFYGEDLGERVGKIRNHSTVLENGVVTIKIELGRIVTKEIWEREFFTDEYFYNEYIMGLNKFWYVGGPELDALIRPLGIVRKTYEDDIMLKRRVVSYIQAVLKPSNNVVDMLNEDLKKRLPPPEK